MKNLFITIFTASTAVYSLFYTSLGGFIGNKGALSKIGLDHPALFAIWGIMTFISLFSGIMTGFGRTKYKFHIALLMIAAVGMLMTICFDFDYSDKTQYILHCIGSLSFSAIMGVTVFLLFILTKNYIFAAVSASIMLSDLALLIMYKETAFIELLPIFAGYIMLCTHNYKKERDRIEAKQQA